MHPFDDDYDELDEPGFESFAKIRRLVGENQHRHQKAAGRRHRGRTHHDRWENDTWDDDGHFDDYLDDEFDRYSGMNIDY